MQIVKNLQVCFVSFEIASIPFCHLLKRVFHWKDFVHHSVNCLYKTECLFFFQVSVRNIHVRYEDSVSKIFILAFISHFQEIVDNILVEISFLLCWTSESWGPHVKREESRGKIDRIEPAWFVKFSLNINMHKQPFDKIRKSRMFVPYHAYYSISLDRRVTLTICQGNKREWHVL